MSASRASSAAAAKGIDRPALVLSRLCLALALLLVPVVAGVFAFGGLQSLSSAMPGPAADMDLADLPGWRTLLIFALTMIPVALMAAALLQASRCLAAFARRQYFSALAVRYMRGFSAFVFLAGVAGMLVPTLVVLVATTAGPGPASLTLSFGSDDLFLLLFAGISWQIARVLGRAVALAEDHAQIV